MEPPLPCRVCLMPLLLVCCALALLPRAAEPVYLEPCDCQQKQNLLCTSWGLRVVPKVMESNDILTYSLGGNFIANISASDFSHLVVLQRLNLQYNHIRVLHPKAFERLACLEERYPGNNLLVRVLHHKAFKRLARLEELYPGNNLLVRVLHPKAFERLARLEELYLGNNLLAALAPGTLRPLVKVRILYVNANEINYLSAASFMGLASLVKLRLYGNVLGSLGNATFSGLSNLLYLHLEANCIRWLSRSTFAGLGKLRFLDLSGNQQNSLRHPDTFRHLFFTLSLIFFKKNIL